jgi:NADPH-dependent 2,4-dienoyl-CoA reductase/sulfur reductase-like enzyme/rhodanese-related sulfurtransferase
MKYIIIGAVAGGASTAARLRRLDEKAEIVIFEKGAYISYANCGLPYYIGDVIKERDKLFVQTAAAFNKRFNIDVRIKTEVTAIDPVSKTITAKNHVTGNVHHESYDKLVLSPGAEPVKPPLPGIELEGIFTLRNVADTDHIKSYADARKNGKVVIVGAGFIGLEMAENLHALGMDITVIEMGKQVLAPVDYPIAAIAQQHLRAKGVKLMLDTTVAGFEKSENGLNVLLKDKEPLNADIVILSIGVKPDTRLAAGAGLQVGSMKGIVVNEYLQTSNTDIYAVGDAIEFNNPITGKPLNTFLAGPANKQGRICANNIVFGNKEKYKGAINTAIVKLFDLTAGATGMAAKHLAVAGIPYASSTTHSGSHAGYYPGSNQITIQITFSPVDGRLLGAQAIGIDGVDKRLDVMAGIIQNKGTIYDLAEFEHAYAPPYSSAKDPVNMVGFVAENIITKKLRVVHWDDVEKIEKEDLLVDVRSATEVANGTIPGAMNIPVDELRDRLGELPKNKNIYIFCQVGLRGYLAQRILLQNGYETVKNISGGYALWEACTNEANLLTKQKEQLHLENA